MAGEIERYISPSIAFEVKPAQNLHYHDKLISSKNTINIMENYLSNEFDENLLLNLLKSDDKKPEAMQYLDQYLHENNGILVFHNKLALFKGFSLVLSDPDIKLRVHCSKIIHRIIPHLRPELDKYMSKVLGNVISNVGIQDSALQKESNQILFVYMKHSLDVFQILHAIAHEGILHSNPRIRKQIVHSFPTLLFPEFKDEDFFDIVHSLVVNLTENHVDANITLQILDKVSDFIGKDIFNGYISRLPPPLKHTYKRSQSSSKEKLFDSNASSRIAIHSKHGVSVIDNEIDNASRYSASKIDKAEERQVSNFAKSGHFDAASMRRRPHHNVYSSLSTLPMSETSNLFPDKYSSLPTDMYHVEELSFIPKRVIEQLSNVDNSVRLQAVETLRDIISEIKDPMVLKENMVPLLSLLQPMFDDKNFRVACGALKVFSVMVNNIGPGLSDCLKLFVFAVSKKLGNVKDSVRSECYKVLLQIMEIVGRQKVLDLFWEKFTHKQYKVREDAICIVIATLLITLRSKNNLKDIDFDVVCKHVTSLLTDNQQVIRKAALDCIAVLGNILGTTSRQLLSAVDSVELRHDNASGVMSAVHARLLRKQLPRLTENMLVEYAIFPPSTAPVTSPQGADVQWILAAEKPKKGSTLKGLPHVQKEEKGHYSFKEDPKRLIENIAPESSMQRQPRRYVSAGKHRQFPWTSQEDITNSKLPSSAPVKNEVKKQPPFQPRNTWGPESELSSQNSSLSMLVSKNKSAQGYEPTIDSGPSYQEIYKRRKEAHLNKPSSVSSNLSSGYSSKNDSVYKPSFAPGGFSASTSSTPSNLASGPGSLSSSCPSAFFEKNSKPVIRRGPRKVSSQMEDTSISSGYYGSEDSDSPIRLKPALARSASKRRDNAVANSKDFLKLDDKEGSDKVSLMLKTTSASPRFDRLANNISVDQVRPMLKTKQPGLASSGVEKFPGPTFKSDLDNSPGSISVGGYTPSGLQKQSVKDSRNEHSVKHASFFDKEARPVNKVQLTNGNNNSNKSIDEANKHKSRSTTRPIVPSDFSPARHRSQEDTADFQSTNVSSIRRSAQNKKREMLQSQPNSDDGFNGSFSEISTDPSFSTFTSSFYDPPHEASTVAKNSSHSDTRNSNTTDVPSFKYSPNTGVTFDPKKVDADVSVIGVRYPGQFSGQSSGGYADGRPLQSSPTSTASSNTSINALLQVNKPPSNSSVHERHRPHRGSSLGMASSSVSPDSVNTSFNIQGKGVFMTSSTASLLSGSDNNDLTSSPKEDIRTRSFHASKEPTKLSGTNNRSMKSDRKPHPVYVLISSSQVDGVHGVAVRQPSLSPEDLSLNQRRTSENEVSLSASLKERKERQKEAALMRGSHNSSLKTKSIQDKSANNTSYSNSKYGQHSEFNKTMDNPTRDSFAKEPVSRLNKTLSPVRVSASSSRDAMDKSSVMASTSGSGTFLSAVLPLENPEKSLSEAIAAFERADREDWEAVMKAMHTIRCLATYHSSVPASRFHDVIILLVKHVSNLRSQVSVACMQTITDLYNNLKKPTVDVDIETVVKALLAEQGKQQGFIKNEVNKTLQTIVTVATSSKILNALLNAGLKHRHKNIRSTTAKFCAQLVDKMGPGKALSGIKDTTDRLLEAVASFITDGSPDVRYYGRYIINELMVHEDFSRCIDRYLSAENAQEVKNAANSIKQRGLGSLSSIGSRNSGGSIRKRNSSASAGSSNGTERFSPSSISAQSRRKGPGTKIFNEQEQGALKALCDGLSEGSLESRKAAVASLLHKVENDKNFVEENITKIMGAYVFLLTTAQTKLNHLGLDSLPTLIVELHPHLRDVASQLIPALLKLASSKQHGEQALFNIDLMIKHFDHSWIIQHFATTAVYGNAKAKQIAVLKLSKLIERVARKKVQIIERQVLPVLWNLLSSNSAPSGVQLRRETAELARTLYKVYDKRLFEFAESKNLSAKLKDILEV